MRFAKRWRLLPIVFKKLVLQFEFRRWPVRASLSDGFLPLVFLSFVAALLAAPARARIPETGFLDRTVTLGGTKYKYQVFVPDNWTPSKKWPVILFLHGVGERGDDGLAQTDIGLGSAIRMNRSRFPAIVVMPQCRKNVWWFDPPMDDLAMAALAQAEKEFQGDPRRVYLTGLSMGGYGAWHLAAKYPGKFAALAPVCGGILRPEEARVHPPQEKKPYTDAAKKIGGNTPVWIFHGAMDDTVPVTESRRMAEAMKALGGEVRYTEYPGVGHDSWNKAYAETELFTWMLSKTLRSKVRK
jgi:predicted peptidase